MENNLMFYTCEEDPEHLYYTDEDDAIEEVLDGMLSPTMKANDVLSTLPSSVTVYCYVPYNISDLDINIFANNMLQGLLEALDDRFGNDDDHTSITEEQLILAKTFVQTIVNNYDVWSCKEISKHEIDTLSWIKENRPYWLEG